MNNKKYVMNLLAWMVFFISTTPVFAAQPGIVLNPVSSAGIDRCAPLGGALRGIEIVSTTHKGADESVGVIKKKGVAEKVFVAGDVKQVVADSVRNTLAKCGYNLSKGTDSLKMSVIIDDLFTKSENDVVVGKDKATMSLKLRLKVPGQNQDYEFQYGIEKSGKTAPFLKAKRFGKLLNATLTDVMNQVAMSKSFADTVKAVSKEISAAPTSGDTTKMFDESQ